jgi:hypothetical protein
MESFSRRALDGLLTGEFPSSAEPDGINTARRLIDRSKRVSNYQTE